MNAHKAVLFKAGEPNYQQVETRQTGEPFPYVMFAGDLYVRQQLSDQHDKSGRVLAYACATVCKIENRDAEQNRLEKAIAAFREIEPHAIINRAALLAAINS